MCGICGYVMRKPISKEALSAMNDTMIRRGPNDAGVELYEAADGYTVGLAQRRLSILDLSPKGHQPMASADGRLEISYNGEIYNFLELKKELNDYPYSSTCDTEVILAAYLKWGINMVDHVQGMFAIALFDREEQALYLIRDRIGKKPLYYALVNADDISAQGTDGLLFGSGLAPIMTAPGFHKEIRCDVLPRYLYQQYINAPDTILRNVYKLEPGSWLRFEIGSAGAESAQPLQNHGQFNNASDSSSGRSAMPGNPSEQDNVSGISEEIIFGRIMIHKYWDIADTYHRMSMEPVRDYQEAKAGLKAELQRAVRQRLISDVPVGTFLSGGYDSSLISAIAQEQSGQPMKTFCIGFDEESYNEAPYAKAIADYLHTDHTELYISEQEMLDLVSKMAECYDEPFADSSQIPTMLVSGLARQKVTVVLSGDGGDEFYCGYNIYDNAAQAQKLDKIGGLAHAVGSLKIGGRNLESRYPFRAQVVAENRDPETKTQFCAPSYLENALRFVGVSGDRRSARSSNYGRKNNSGNVSGKTLLNRMAGDGDMVPIRYEWESHYGVSNWQIRRMLLDMDTYLPGDILCKVDRASMWYSLEARCPILDTGVMEYSFRIPHEFKYQNGDKKHILKDLTYDYIPKELLERPKKGFGVPLDKWLRGPLKEQLLDYAGKERLQKQGIFDAEFVSAFIQNYVRKGDGGPATGANYSKIAWSFYMFQQWYDRWMTA